MYSVASVFSMDGTLAGAGVLVAPDLVLTCAHVVNVALNRPKDGPGRPPSDKPVKVRFEAAPTEVSTATIDDAADAWSDPPADRAAGADLCLLRLKLPKPNAARPAVVAVHDLVEPILKVMARGYPED